MNLGIFKAYDIRGLYPDDIDKEAAFKIGRGLVVFLNRHQKGKKKIIVGRDNRFSSPVIARAIKEGAKKEGADVIDIGLTTTPMFYFATNHLKADGGAMITASHNPPQYNGIKAVKKEGENIAKGTGGEELKNIVAKEQFSKNKKPGKEKKVNVMPAYLKYNFRFIDSKKVMPLKIVVDTANAVSSLLIPNFQKKLKQIKFFHLFSKLDGTFPNHNPDPLIKENLKSLVKEVIKRKADLGVAFDGDGDRVIFIDEKGNQVDGDIITALIAKIILKERKGEKILFDIRSSKVVNEAIKENGGRAYISKTGHSFIKPKMKKYDVYFGGEVSGHYYYGPNNAFETPLFVLFKIIEEISREKLPFSKILEPFKRYVNSGEINFKIEDRKGAVKKIEQYFIKKKMKISRLDGVKGEGKDFWCLVRPSNTEPLLRMVVEAKDKKTLKEKIKEFKKVITDAKF